MTDRPRCAWCKGEIPAAKRRDAETCGKPCRQARHRFKSLVGHPTAVELGRPRRLAYADPPYPGLSSRYYGEHPDYAGEVDHAALVERLLTFDAFALSTSAEALPRILRLLPDDVRVAAWVRGGRPNHAASRPRSSWEPVIYGGMLRVPSRSPGRHDASRSPADATARPLDSLVYHAKARTTDPGRVIGAKPAPFARWIFELLAAQPYDDLADLFPGSGGISRAWEAYRSTDAPAAVAQDDAS